jgi:hypothetical protein
VVETSTENSEATENSSLCIGCLLTGGDDDDDSDNGGNGRNSDRNIKWYYCADEGKFCRFYGKRLVRYGTATKAMTKNMKDGVMCTNEVFGKDPVPGEWKGCYITRLDE